MNLRALTGLLVLLGSSACSAIVGGPVSDSMLACDQPEGAPNPCAFGEICLDGFCLPNDTCRPECVAPEVCVDGMCRPPALEICNGLDDNGNGEADEGLRNDADADGYYTCDADPLLVDCVDRDGIGGIIFPGAPELCDGYDNDCSPATIDGSDAARGCIDGEVCAEPIDGGAPQCLARMSCRLTGCSVGDYCDQATDRCVPMTNCNDPGMGCPPGERCDATSGRCELLRGLPIGDPCRADVECGSGACYRWSALDLDPVGDAIGRCGAPCCNNDSCSGLGTGLVCWAPGSGARSCMPSALVDSDAATCSRPSDCSLPEVCRLASITTSGDTFNALACGEPTGSSLRSCGANRDCASGLCLGGNCALPCATQSGCRVFDCLTPILCIPQQVGFCAYWDAGGDWITACSATAPSLRPAGEPCTANGQCQEAYCNLSSGRCSATCCADSDCTATGGVCRPVDNAGWEMRCVPRPPE